MWAFGLWPLCVRFDSVRWLSYGIMMLNVIIYVIIWLHDFTCIFRRYIMHVGPIYVDMGDFDILARWWHFSCVIWYYIKMCLLMNVMIFRDSWLSISTKLVRKSICARVWWDRGAQIQKKWFWGLLGTHLRNPEIYL